MVAGAPMHIRGYFSHFRQLFKPATKCWVAILALAYLFYLDFQAIGSLPPSVQLFFWGGVLFLVFCLLMGLGLPAAGNQRQSLPSLPAAVEGGPSPRHWRLPRSLAILAVLVIPAVVLFFSPRWFWLLIFVWSFLWPAAAGYLWARLTVRLFGPLVN